jgi:hypothetical protein
MLPQAEDVHLAVLFVPVATYALENGRPVVKGMGHNAYLRILKWDLFPAQERVCIWRHGEFSVTDILFNIATYDTRSTASATCGERRLAHRAGRQLYVSTARGQPADS